MSGRDELCFEGQLALNEPAPAPAASQTSRAEEDETSPANEGDGYIPNSVEPQPFAPRRFRRYYNLTMKHDDSLGESSSNNIDSSWCMMSTSDFSSHCRRRLSNDPYKEVDTCSTAASSLEGQLDMSISGRIPEDQNMSFSGRSATGKQEDMMSSWSAMNTSMNPHRLRMRYSASSDPSSRCWDESMSMDGSLSIHELQDSIVG